MKKLNILKSIIDLFWIVSLPLIPFIFIGFILFDNSKNGFPITINEIHYDALNNKTKAILILSLMSYLVLMYCIYLFKKILRSFKMLKIFDDVVLINLKKIGFLLVLSAFLNGVPSFIYRVLYAGLGIYKGEYAGTVKLELGFSSFLTMLCLGFFMVLSEVFKIAKTAKQENDLTI